MLDRFPQGGKFPTIVSAGPPLWPRHLLWVALLAIGVAACLTLAVVVRRRTSEALRQLANVRLTSASVRTQEFNAELDQLREATLRAGTGRNAPERARSAQARRRLREWLSDRMNSARSESERQVLAHLGAQMQAYFAELDDLAAASGALDAPLDRGAIVRLDEDASVLRRTADDYVSVHDDEVRTLLQTSLGSVLWMRNLLFLCAGLLLAAIAAVVVLLYQDVVWPLRGKLVESETLLAKSEKLAALGTLAAGVAHEIRNPLTAIKARLYTLRRSQTLPEGRDDIQAIALEVDRLEHIVRDVLSYARPADPVLGPLELSAWLRDFAAFVEPELAARQLRLAVEADGEATVHGDPGQLRQILLNLIRNAQEALEGRAGRITLALRRERAILRGRAAATAVLTVADDGPGIPPEIQSRLFDPFFTTKASGTGLGLSIVARLVENQRGEIGFQSAPHAGTRFFVRLPLADGTPGPVLP